jgi:6-phosphogluconate dehydrogenase (decarboxylating)
MQLGMIGWRRMGTNRVRHLIKDDHVTLPCGRSNSVVNTHK